MKEVLAKKNQGVYSVIYMLAYYACFIGTMVVISDFATNPSRLISFANRMLSLAC